MAKSFNLPKFAGPIPCPRCNRLDCARVERTKGRRVWWCGVTYREVSRALLRRRAVELDIPKAQVVDSLIARLRDAGNSPEHTPAPPGAAITE